MRRFLLIAVLPVLLAGTSHAQRSMRLDSLRFDAFRLLEMNTAGDSVTNVDRANVFINMAIQQVCNDFPAIEKLDTVTLSADSVAIALNSDFLRAKWVFLNATNKWFPLTPLNEVAQDTLMGIIKTKVKATFRPADTVGAPYYWTSNDRIFTYPKFTAGPHAQLVIAYFAEDSTLNANGSTPQINSSYRKAMLYYSCFLIKSAEQMYDIAQFWLGMYEREKPVEG